MKHIAHITDLHLDEKYSSDHGVNTRENWKRVLEDVVARGIDEVVFGGDIGEKESNRWFFDSFRKYALNVNITPGNHDIFPELVRYVKTGSPHKTDELYHAFEEDHIRCIFLDSSSYKVSPLQLGWLAEQLRTEKKPVVFIHHPVLGVDAAVDRMYPLKNRDSIRETLLKCGQEVILFCGHYHMDDEQTYDNIRQWITPAASYQFRKDTHGIEVNAETFGYRIISFNAREVTSETVLLQRKQV